MGHQLLMMVCCVPMLVIVGVLVLTGVLGSGAIVYALVCTFMMGRHDVHDARREPQLSEQATGSIHHSTLAAQCPKHRTGRQSLARVRTTCSARGREGANEA